MATPAPAAAQVWFWTYTHNIAPVLGITSLGYPHLWSLAVEEQFYLLWPAAVFLLRERTLALVIAGMAVAAIATRAVMLVHGMTIEKVFVFTPCRIDALAFGAGVALAYRSRICKGIAAASLGAALGIGLPLAIIFAGFESNLWAQTAKFTLVGLFYASVLVYALSCSGSVRGFLSNRYFAAIARYSYAMYVFHPAVIETARGIPASAPIQLAAGFFGTFAVAWISWQLLESRFLKLKWRFS
jgi:peptidoglycan/LPS O-acetylase OafA/YrhL